MTDIPHRYTTKEVANRLGIDYRDLTVVARTLNIGQQAYKHSTYLFTDKDIVFLQNNLRRR